LKTSCAYTLLLQIYIAPLEDKQLRRSGLDNRTHDRRNGFKCLRKRGQETEVRGHSLFEIDGPEHLLWIAEVGFVGRPTSGSVCTAEGSMLRTWIVPDGRGIKALLPMIGVVCGARQLHMRIKVLNWMRSLIRSRPDPALLAGVRQI